MHSLSHSGTVNGAVASLSSESKGVTVLPNVVSGLVGLTEFAEPGQVLFSPMTLNSIEQTILGLGQNSAFNNHAVLSPKDNVINKSTSKLELITKRTDTDDGDFSEDDSTTNDEWEPGSKIIRKFDGSMEYAAASPNYSSTDSNGPIGSASTKKTSNRPTGPRKPRKDIQLTPEEEERRNMRRERNKQAAAKCRQKRVDLTNQLQSETEALEAEQKRLQDEIKTFQREKEELEYILASHRLHCGTNSISGINTSSAVGPAISVPLPAASTGVSLISSAVHMTSAITSAQNLSSQELKVEAGDIRPVVALSAINNKTVVNRPNSFPTSSLRTVSMVNMTNGTNVLSFGLESMLDGHTGLTPITGMPSCAIATAGQQLPTMTPGDAIENGHLGGLTAL